jgi:hypothetical protein
MVAAAGVESVFATIELLVVIPDLPVATGVVGRLDTEESDT